MIWPASLGTSIGSESLYKRSWAGRTPKQPSQFGREKIKSTRQQPDCLASLKFNISLWHDMTRESKAWWRWSGIAPTEWLPLGVQKVSWGRNCTSSSSLFNSLKLWQIIGHLRLRWSWPSVYFFRKRSSDHFSSMNFKSYHLDHIKTPILTAITHK